MDSKQITLAFVALVLFGAGIASISNVLKSPLSSKTTAFVAITEYTAGGIEGTAFKEGKLKAEYIGAANEGLKKIPSYLVGIFAGKTTNIYIKMNSGETREYYATMEGGKIKEVGLGLSKRADMRLEVSEKPLREIAIAENPVDKAVELFESGKIKYRGVTTEGKIKETVSAVTVKTYSIARGIWGALISLIK